MVAVFAAVPVLGAGVVTVASGDTAPAVELVAAVVGVTFAVADELGVVVGVTFVVLDEVVVDDTSFVLLNAAGA